MAESQMSIDEEIKETLKKLQQLQAKKSSYSHLRVDPILTEDVIVPPEKTYKVLRNIFTEEDAAIAREFFRNKSTLDLTGTDYTAVSVNDYCKIPALEKKMDELFPDMQIFATHWFSGEAGAKNYSDWHTGINFQKTFVGHPLIITVWIPLQDLTSKTNGRLWFYNGPLLPHIIHTTRGVDKKNYLFQYYMLYLMKNALEQHKITEDCAFGDGFVFKEIMPHAVDTECNIKREIISVRLIEKGAVIDQKFIDEVKELGKDEKFLTVKETHVEMAVLGDFLQNLKNTYESAQTRTYEKAHQK